MSENHADQPLHFLSGGGEMGELIRNKDWSKTSVGPPHSWPQSLRTTLSIILNSRFPMFLWWGPDLICFYNDAYRPSLGREGKHPSILGMNAEAAWPEIWDIIKPLIDQVLAGGAATWSEDQLIPIYRNGKIEDVYWTFSYSPVHDESDRIAGVLVTCYETTEKIGILNAIREREDQLNFTLQAAELGTWDLNPATNRFVGNDRLKSWFGLDPATEIDLDLAIAKIAQQDRQKVIDAIQAALNPDSGGNYDIEYTIIHPTGTTRRLLAKGKAEFNENGIATRFSGTLQDVTAREKSEQQQRESIEKEHIAHKKLQESEKRFRDIVYQAPLGITILRGPDFVVEMANEVYLQLVDRKEKDFVGQPLFDSLPEVKDMVKEPLTSVLNTGVPFYGNEFPVTLRRYGREDKTYFNFVYDAIREEDGTIYGIIVVAMEVTEIKQAKHLLAESEKYFRQMVLDSPIGMAIFRGTDIMIEMANTVMLRDIWNKQEYEVIGKKLVEVFPELREQKFPSLLLEVYKSGKVYRENDAVAYVHRPDGMRRFYLDFEYAPLFNPDGSVYGILVTVSDVTEKSEARLKVEESEEKLNIVISASELGTWELDLKSGKVQYSDRYLEIFGYPERVVVTHSELVAQIHPDDLPIRQKAFQDAFKTGHLYQVTRIIWADGSLHWVEAKGKVFYDENNTPTHLMGTVRDVTEEKNYQQRLQEREQKFRTLANSMPQLVWTGDAEGNLNYFNQSVFDYSGMTPDEVINGGWIQIVHPDEREENIRLWSESIRTGQDFLFEHRFMRYDGVYRWQLSRAVPQRDETGTIQMWVGTSTDIQDQKTSTQKLEKLVQERTQLLQESNEKLEISIQDLKKMNGELQSFAYVSSHDLQEPLRKIQTFADRIQEKESRNLSDTGKDFLARMQDAARRMQTLIEDLLAYSRTNTTERVFKKVNLHDLIDEVRGDFNETLAEKHGVIHIGKMCDLRIIPFQFSQLMHNLIGNALKFSKPDVPPVIHIDSEILEGSSIDLPGIPPAKMYCRLSVTDNGIGFSPEYKDRIFEVFQRLHGRSEYKGTGIGLAIVKKIVDNHYGVIVATGEVGEGARFDMYLPVG